MSKSPRRHDNESSNDIVPKMLLGAFRKLLEGASLGGGMALAYHYALRPEIEETIRAGSHELEHNIHTGSQELEHNIEPLFYHIGTLTGRTPCSDVIRSPSLESLPPNYDTETTPSAGAVIGDLNTCTIYYDPAFPRNVTRTLTGSDRYRDYTLSTVIRREHDNMHVNLMGKYLLLTRASYSGYHELESVGSLIGLVKRMRIGNARTASVPVDASNPSSQLRV